MKKQRTEFSIRFKKSKKQVIEFANLQGNFNDTITYLIEKEIAENGIRNLQMFIPIERNEEYFRHILREKTLYKNTETHNSNKEIFEETKNIIVNTDIVEEIASTDDKHTNKTKIKVADEYNEIPECYVDDF